MKIGKLFNKAQNGADQLFNKGKIGGVKLFGKGSEGSKLLGNISKGAEKVGNALEKTSEAASVINPEYGAVIGGLGTVAHGAAALTKQKNYSGSVGQVTEQIKNNADNVKNAANAIKFV